MQRTTRECKIPSIRHASPHTREVLHYRKPTIAARQCSDTACLSPLDLQTAQKLLKNGANIHTTASNRRKDLHRAAEKGDIDLIRFLLKQVQLPHLWVGSGTVLFIQGICQVFHYV